MDYSLLIRINIATPLVHIKHHAPRTYITLYKGALWWSLEEFHWKLYIARDAQEVDANQLSKKLTSFL